MANISHKIFIDSSVLLAFVDRADANHQKALKIMDHLARNNYQLFSSIQVVSEVYGALSREVGVSIALEFVDSILQSDMEMLFPQRADLISSYRILKTNRDKQATLREVLIACLMQKRGINQILTFTYWHSLFGTQVSNLTTFS
jgi:predicted nucleic acid-binding protein